MITVKTKHNDGTGRVDELGDVKRVDAVVFIEQMALDYADNSWTGEWDHIFPIYWEAFENGTLYGRGFVDETGSFF